MPPDEIAAGVLAAHEATASSFRRWLDAQPEPMDPARVAEGRALLEGRRAAMVQLIRHDPRRALEQALSFAERMRLPVEWTPWLEERFSTLADFSVFLDCSPASTGTARLLLVRPGHPGLQGVTWGDLARYRTKKNLPVDGIALEGWTALEDNAVKIVSGREREAVEGLFPPAPAAEAVKNAEATALIGGQLHRFATAREAGEMRDLYARIAALPGPHSAGPLAAALADGKAPVVKNVLAAARNLASSWTETPKSVLVLNTIFPGTTPLGTQAEWQATMTEVSNWISEASYGKTNLVATVLPNVFTLPNPASYYEPSDDYHIILNDAKALALAAGFNPAHYDITVVAFPRIGRWGFGGLGTIGGGNHWLNGYRDAGLMAHEFGHNYGLYHASSWDANDGSVMPDTGAPNALDPRHNEYGDRFSRMGSGSFPDSDYGPQMKAELNWITPAQIHAVTAPGTYRIHRFDAASANAHPKLALKLKREWSQTFWVGYRRRFAGNDYLNHGAYVGWEWYPSLGRLLDMTPDSRTTNNYDDKEDAALAIGRTFSDPTGFLHITPTAQGGTAPNEWLDVRVDFMTPGNRPPTAEIHLPPQPVAARTNVVLSATAADEDNDALQYSWDLGSSETPSSAVVNWAFNAGGNRQITLRVTDGKGGLAVVTRTIVVTDPLTQIEEINLPDAAGGISDAAWLGGLQVGANAGYTLTTADCTAWHRTPNSLDFTPGRLAAGAGRIVAVGGIYSSSLSRYVAASAVTTDAATWTQVPHGTTPELKAVAFRNGLFAAVGAAGTILTSPDGIVWTPQASPSNAELFDVTATGAGFLACGMGGAILASPDGLTWTLRPNPDTVAGLGQTAASGDEAVIAAGNGYLHSSDSGATWQLRQFNLGLFRASGVVFSEGVWVASESRYRSDSGTHELWLAVSADGLRWDLLPSRPLLSRCRVCLMDGRMWIYGQSGKILRSGLINPGNRPPTLTPAWPAAITARVPASLSATAADADGDATEVFWERTGPVYRFGRTASQTFLVGGSRTLTAWASDGRGGRTPASRTYEVEDPLLYWTNITPAAFAGTAMTLAARSADRVVIAGGRNAADAPAATATGTAAWTRQTLPLTVNGLAWRSPGFVAVGQSYDSSVSANRSAIMHSTDGRSWSNLQNFSGFYLSRVCDADGAYVAVGYGGAILRSTDGLVWQAVASGVTTNLNGVAFAGARGLAVGSNRVLRSEDSGATWTDISSTSGSASQANGIFSAGGRLYVPDQSGKLRFYLPDTRTWRDAVTSGPANFGNLRSIVVSGSTYVAIGWQNDPALGRNRRFLAVSLDGVTWESGEMLWPADPGSLFDGGGSLMTTGPNLLLTNVQGPPGLTVSPSALTINRGTTETGLLGILQVGNTGSGSLNWTAGSNAAWLSASPASGTATAGGADFVEIVQSAARAAGTHTGTLTFSAPGVPSRQVTVTVNAFLDDHGGTQDTATPLTPGTAMDANLQVSDDIDWFVFDLAAPGSLKVWTTGTLQTIGELHGAAGLIRTDGDIGAGRNFQIERSVLPGRYWVKVRRWPFGNTGPYQLQSAFMPAGPPFVLKAWGTDPDGNRHRFTVATALGYRYHVQKSASPDTGWIQAGPTVTATAEETVLSLPVETSPTSPRGFFRIAVQAP